MGDSALRRASSSGNKAGRAEQSRRQPTSSACGNGLATQLLFTHCWSSPLGPISLVGTNLKAMPSCSSKFISRYCSNGREIDRLAEDGVDQRAPLELPGRRQPQFALGAVVSFSLAQSTLYLHRKRGLAGIAQGRAYLVSLAELAGSSSSRRSRSTRQATLFQRAICF